MPSCSGTTVKLGEICSSEMVVSISKTTQYHNAEEHCLEITMFRMSFMRTGLGVMQILCENQKISKDCQNEYI